MMTQSGKDMGGNRSVMLPVLTKTKNVKVCLTICYTCSHKLLGKS